MTATVIRRREVLVDLRPEGRERLRRLMGKGAELSYREVAEAAGFKAHSFIQKLLSGEKRGMDPEHAFALAQFLGVPLEHLFEVTVPVSRSADEESAE